MNELKYAEVEDEKVMEMIRERIREMKRLLAEIRDLLKVE